MSLARSSPSRAILIRRVVVLVWLGTMLLAAARVTVDYSVAQAAPAISTTADPGPEPGLDRTGRTLPRTNYAVPAGAVVMSPAGSDTAGGGLADPVRTLNRAIALARPGGTVVLRGGEYRDWYHDGSGNRYAVVDKPLTFQAYPGESPWLDGSDVIPAARWAKVRGTNLWRMAWSTPQFCDGHYYDRPLTRQLVRSNAGPCGHYDMSRDKAHPRAVDPQMVFVDDRELHQASTSRKLAASAFFYDWKARQLYVATPPAAHRVEVARRPIALALGNRQDYRVLGLGFRKYASNEFPNLTNAALRIGGTRSVVENSVFTMNAAAGLTMSNPQPGSIVRRSVFAGNGYVGMGANGASQSSGRNDLLVTGNLFSGNNAQHFGTRCTVSCGQAAAKFAHMVGIRISYNLVERTRGHAAGLWCDLDCSEAQVVRNVVRANAGGPGIFYEVSDRGIIAGNVVTRNLYGISVASPNTKIYNNTLVDNRQGMRLYDDPRTRGRGGWDDIGPDTRNLEVVNNVVVGPGYSLMAYAMRKKSPRPNTGAENLFRRLDHNSLAQGKGGKPAYVYWRTRGGRLTLFRTSSTLVKRTGLGAGERWLMNRHDPFFVDAAGGDLRLSPRSRAYGSAATPSADVAGALAVAGSAVRHRGALG